MPITDSSLENRVAELSRQVEFLTEEFAKLSAKVEGLPAPSPQSTLPAARTFGEQPAAASASTHQSITTVLSTVATVSFLLVVALVLRTVVDNGAIDVQVGSYLGLIYAGLLVAHSFWRYSRGHPHVPVYSTCGALLIFSIVYESLTRFNTLSAQAAYSVLALSLIAMSVLGLRFVIPTAITVGALGASLAGVALEFPNSHFVWLAGLILMANLVSFYARRIPGCQWLRWVTLIVALVFWSLWTTKVRAELIQGRTLPPEMALPWLIPSLGAFALAYVAMVVRSVSRAKLPFGTFETILPLVNVVLVFAVAYRVASAGWGSQAVVGTVGACVALVHMALAYGASGRGENGAKAASAFILAGVVLIALALPAATENRLGVLWVWSLGALAIGFLSGHWANGNVRGVSYLFQYFTCGMAVVLGWLAVDVPIPKAKLATATALSTFCFIHYAWCRYRVRAPQGGILASVDPSDRTAVGLFFVALVYGFAAARIVLHTLLPGTGPAFEATFSSGQSVSINASALVLFLWGVRRDNGEILAVAFAVAVVGSMKVFGYDFFWIQGLQLVVSVFSFGVTAGVGSLVWRRRQVASPASPSG